MALDLDRSRLIEIQRYEIGFYEYYHRLDTTKAKAVDIDTA